MRNVVVTFAPVQFPAEAAAAAAVAAPPAYLLGGTPWDLSLLIDQNTVKQNPQNASILAGRLRAVNMSGGGFPLAAVEALSTLDGPQAAAVQVSEQPSAAVPLLGCGRDHA